MFKSVVTIILVSLIIPSIYLLPGCSSSATKPGNADEISADLLQAVIDVDFERYKSYFTGELHSQLGTEQDFIEEVTLLKDTYGEYVADSLDYSGFETTEDGQIAVYYNAEFTRVPNVQVRTTYMENNGEMTVIGFWLEQR